MLIESQPQQSTTPPTPQLGMPSAMSSPTPHGQYDPKYDMVDRLKHRVENYRQHHEISFTKNQKTIESQNIKMKAETQRLTQQFLNNSHNNTNNSNKSKQQKSVNSGTGQRNANKRSNASANNNADSKCDSSETKPSKMSKVANNRNSAAKESGNNPAFRNNCAKFGANSQSIQMDVKMKPSVVSNISANSHQLLSINATVSSAPEIKREVIDNSYLQSMTFEQIHDFLKDTNTTTFPPAGIEPFGPDELKDILNDSILAEDGFGATNDGFGDEDFIKKFLEDINESSYTDMTNIGLHMSQNSFKGQQSVANHSNPMVNPSNGFNCNNSGNPMNSNLNMNPNQNNLINASNSMNSMTFMVNPMQTATNNDMTSYHPIQPRLQQNLMSNIPNRSSLQINTSQPTMNVNNTPIRHYMNQSNSGSAQAQSPQLLLQQMPAMQQSNNGAMVSHSLQSAHQSPQPVHMIRLPNTVTGQKMVPVVPKTEDMSGQLSMQVSPQTQQMPNTSTSSQVPLTNAQSVQAAANASIKLKQMAQQAQQKTATHHWVITHSNPPIINQQQPISQQMSQQMKQQSTPTMASAQRMTGQTMQQNVRPVAQNQMMSPEPNIQQNPMSVQMQQNQSQNFFGQQMPQQMYWQSGQQQHNQQHNPQHQSQHQSQHHPAQQHQTQHQTQHQAPHQSPHQGQHQPGSQAMQPPQSQTQPQAIQQQNMQQNQQNYANYWSHPSQMSSQMSSQMGQMVGQPSQTQSQHYFNNNNYNNYF